MKTSEIITSFKQGGTGNCVSIAVIKAGIQIFGVDKVVHFERTPENGYSFTMRDGFEGTLTAGEIIQVAEGSEFLLLENKEVLEYANLCFASMAKRALSEEHEGARTILDAVESLNNGEYYYLGADWLGLRHHKRPVGLKYIWNNIGVVGASRGHCFFCSEGLVDDYGIPNRISLIDRIKYKFFSYYRIAAEPHY